MSEKDNDIQVVEKEVGGIVQYATDLRVATQADGDAAAARVNNLMGLRKRWCAYWDPECKKADELHKSLVGKRKALTDKIDQVRKVIDDKILTWQRAERAKAEVEERRLQAIKDEEARREREKQEAAERKQRDIEEAKRREAEAARTAMEQAKGAERERLRKEAEAAEAAANAANVKAEARKEAAENTSVPVIKVEAPRMKGTRETWKAECVDISTLIAAAKPGTVAASFLEFNQSAADSFGRSTKGAVPVAGIRFVAVESLSSRSK
jgi:hypothetical protein